MQLRISEKYQNKNQNDDDDNDDDDDDDDDSDNISNMETKESLPSSVLKNGKKRY